MCTGRIELLLTDFLGRWFEALGSIFRSLRSPMCLALYALIWVPGLIWVNHLREPSSTMVITVCTCASVVVLKAMDRRLPVCRKQAARSVESRLPSTKR